MRLSPVLIALVATSATIGLSNPAQGQTLYYAPVDKGTSAKPEVPPEPTPGVVLPQPDTSQPEIPLAQREFSSPLITSQVVVPIAPEKPVSAIAPSLPTSLSQAQPGSAAPEPTAPEPSQPTPGPTLDLPSSQPQPAEAEPRVLVAEVVVSGATPELENIVYSVIRTRAGRASTRTELQEDINAIFATGYFSNVRAVPEDTPLGVRVTFEVKTNPVLQSVRIEGNQVLPQTVVDDIFRPQYGKTLNLRQFQDGVKQVNKWYQDKGYVLAQVLDVPKVSEDGIVTLQVAEGVVEGIQVRFLKKEGEDTDEKGQPISGRTRDFIITREFTVKPGDVFNRAQIEKDLQRVFSLGIFEDVRLSLSPGQDPRKVVIVANVIERNSGSLAAGVGFSSASGLFGTLSYQEQNLGGNNQKLGAEFQLGERELLFDLSFTDPWIAGDPFRTSYTVNLFNRRTISLVFDTGNPLVRLANGDIPRIDRLGGGVNFTRPLNDGWIASLGLQYQQVTVRDAARNIVTVDQLGNPLSFSGTGTDDLFSVQFGAVRDLRNDPLRPTSGSLFRIGTEQSIPIGSGNILLNRVRGSYSYYIPVSYLNLSEGPQALAFNIQAGTAFGDLPPYEAFALGGVNSVRGYEEGALGSGRSFVQATAEYRFPVFSIIGAALFFDAATDLGTGNSVIGNPAGVRGKPGSGFGYGLGIRIQSPLGPIRIDYGINDQGGSRFQFGIGERF
ncbi:hypothetical protein BST81_12435 [Leptolyngbya sp. 'hensonii']|uniref:BamA/TamA family outer membrane protein n=1 Tax=Leptolyngbya sp. 'hensonii' TaxID=1922337 RepID=UPI00094FE52B|nr:BamA/TamA family outer membrane protein [Leptolyngbya sp. 'hensonii']OLP18184.1 hypothetical protein BST81_12435 [Leptolyngbya sp. 'hensonii']